MVLPKVSVYVYFFIPAQNTLGPGTQMSTSKFCLVTESVHCCLDQAPEYQNELRIITIVHHAMVANCYAYRINQKFGFNQVFKCWQKADSMSVALPIRNATFQVCFWIKGKLSLGLSFTLFANYPYSLFYHYQRMSNLHSGYHYGLWASQFHVENLDLSDFFLDNTHVVLI